MSFREVGKLSLNPLFDEVFRKTQEKADADLHLLDREKASQLADEFFSYLQKNLGLVNGADPDLNALIERLAPYKSNPIEPLLQKIIKDLRDQNRRLIDDSSQKVVPFSTSLAAFPLPILDTAKECAERATQFLRKEREKDHFSLSETLEMCCFLVAQNMQTEAALLFNFHTLRYFIENPQKFTEQLLDYVQEAEWTLDPDAVQINTSILRNLFKASIIESTWRDLLVRTPSKLFKWIQDGGPGFLCRVDQQ